MRRTVVWAVMGGVFCMSMSSACSDGAVVRDTPAGGTGGSAASPGVGGDDTGQGGTMGAGGAGAIPSGQGVGEDCSADNPCRDGLICNSSDVCEPSGDKAPGESCVISAECDNGQCLLRECATAGDGEDGASCVSDADCAAGLRCNIVGLGLACAPEGTGDIGADCATANDCYGGLTCLMDQCAVPQPGLPPFGTPWEGVDCEAPVDKNVKAYFEVPGAAGAEEGDFFRLPFPTDVRKSGNTLDLTGFPTPGSALIGIDPVQLYVDAVTENDSGWGAYPTVLFRFSGGFDFNTFGRDAVQFVDITDPANSRSLGWRRFYTDARTNYICDNFVAVQPPFGGPLEPGHTYAVIILSEVGTTIMRDRDETPCTEDADCESDVCNLLTDCMADDSCVCAGRPVVASENMGDVLKGVAPTDAALKAAHTAFAPLRAYLAAVNQPAANVLTATVFTVGDIRAPMTDLAAAVAAADAPTASDWVKCDGVAPSPCPQAEEDRACGDDVPGYDEYHALLSIPVFQQGTAPYLTPADGGGIDTANPSTEEVCMSITVPEGAPPAAGWAAVVHAHGTGGSFRSHVRDEVAGVLAAATPKFAVIGIDQVEHGPRRGASMQHPNNLFFNFLNPAVTRGNPLQGAADQLSVARFAKALDVAAAVTTGEAIKLDPTQLFFFGHSQGSTEGSLMLPFGDDYKAAVLSGNGASLRDALRTKTQPVNIRDALTLVLQDPLMSHPTLGPGVTLYHPVLSLLQQWIDPADPLNFADLLGRPLQGHTGKHVFQTFGIEDTFSPPVTMGTFTVAGNLKQVTPHASADPPWEDSDNPLPAPVAVGYAAAGTGITLGMRQYGAPATSDGHFVVFDVPAANDDMVLFFTSATGATPPVIGQ